MEKTTQLLLPGSRQSSMRRLFKWVVHDLLTASSKEEIVKAFGSSTNAEQEFLHRLLIQVTFSLHELIESEFEAMCLETQVGTILDTVEQLVEEQRLDPLRSDKTDIRDVWQNMSAMKKNEIQHLSGVLKMAEERKHVVSARVEQLKKEMHDSSGAADVIEKMRNGFLNYGTSNNSDQNNP